MKLVLLTLAVVIVAGACSVMVIVDSAIYVTGTITDEDGKPLSGADVSVGFSEGSLGDEIMKVKTNQDGCFVVDWEDGAYDPLYIRISKDGYTTIQDSKPYAGYFIRGQLSRLNTPTSGELIWTEIDISDPNLPLECE